MFGYSVEILNNSFKTVFKFVFREIFYFSQKTTINKYRIKTN